MVTEVTAQVRQSVSRSSDGLRGSQENISVKKTAGTTEVRQDLPVTLQSMPPATESQQTPESGKASPVKLDKAVDELNSFVQNVRRELRFSVDDNSGDVVVKVIDSENDEIIRQIPPDDVLQMRRFIADNGHTGILMTAKV